MMIAATVHAKRVVSVHGIEREHPTGHETPKTLAGSSLDELEAAATRNVAGS